MDADEKWKKRRHRGWAFTLNNYTPEEEKELQSLNTVYLQYGYEIAPTTGTPHLQGYIKFKEALTWTAMKKLVPERMHFKPVLYENCLIKYNNKDGKVFESGVRPKSSKQKGQTTQERYAQAIDEAKAGDLSAIEPDLYLRYYRTLTTIAKDHAVRPETLDTTTGLWIMGPSGCGKTSFVYKEYGSSLYLKTAKNKWWDSYRGEDYVLIDDVDYECLHLSHYLKIWADHYPFPAEIKGSSLIIRPKLIIVTSNYRIGELWGEENVKQSLYRRFKILDLSI